LDNLKFEEEATKGTMDHKEHNDILKGRDATQLTDETPMRENQAH